MAAEPKYKTVHLQPEAADTIRRVAAKMTGLAERQVTQSEAVHEMAKAWELMAASGSLVPDQAQPARRRKS
jgi:hypothetical protein